MSIKGDDVTIRSKFDVSGAGRNGRRMRAQQRVQLINTVIINAIAILKNEN